MMSTPKLPHSTSADRSTKCHTARPSIRRMTATFQGVNLNLHDILDFARTENENPGHPAILIV